MKKGILILTILALSIGLTKVKAANNNMVWIPSATYKIGYGGTYQNTTNLSNYYTLTGSINNSSQLYFIKFDSQDNLPNNANEITINILLDVLSPQTTIGATGENTSQTCTIQHNTGPNGYEYTSFACTGNTTSSGSPNINDVDYAFNLSYFYNGNEGLQAPCYAKSNNSNVFTYTCPITTSTIDGFIISINTIRNNFQFRTGIYYLYSYDVEGTQQIIDNQNQNNQNIMSELNQTAEYNETLNTNQKGANETVQAGLMEDQLINATDFNQSLLDGMTIDTNASSFIWTIVDALRNMNVAIVTIFTSIMGIGILKLVLNR